jgi:integrase/recombinase XerD
MRISELTHLNISDIRFDIGILSINGKGGKERMVPVPQAMLDMLRDYLNAMRVRMKAKDDATPDYVFPVCYGNKIKPISRQSCWIILQNLCKKAGIKRHISPHILRHSLATHLLKNGADVRSIQIILGHENLATMQIYTHVETGHLRKVYDKKHPRS